jgi:ABC-2 type transport system permease protein
MNSGQHWDLFCMLTRTEFRMRAQGAVLGFLWSLLLPLLQFAILYTLFTQWMGPRIGNYAAYLLVGIVVWNFFAAATTHGLTSLRRKAGIISNYAFPKVLVVLSTVAAVLISHLLEWAVLLCLLCAMGVGPSVSWLLLPAFIVAEVFLALGVALILSFLVVGLRDLDHFWGLLLYALFFATPIFYTADIVGGAGLMILQLNPLAVLVDAARALLIDGIVPTGMASFSAFLFVWTLMGFAAFTYGSRDVVERL